MASEALGKMHNTAYSTADGQRLPRDLTDRQKQDIAEAFRTLDVNGQSTITPNDLKVALRALGYEPSEDAVRHLVAQMDRGGVSSNLVLSEFEEIMRQKFFSTDKDDVELQLAFPLFTRGKSEFISFDDLKRVAAEVGETIPDDVLRDLIREADVIDRDDCISMEEFMKMLSSDK